MKSLFSETGIDLDTPDGVTELEARIQCRLNGRVRGFRLDVVNQAVVLRGRVQTYYAKQLAQEAVMGATDLPILANKIEVS